MPQPARHAGVGMSQAGQSYPMDGRTELSRGWPARHAGDAGKPQKNTGNPRKEQEIPMTALPAPCPATGIMIEIFRGDPPLSPAL